MLTGFSTFSSTMNPQAFPQDMHRVPVFIGQYLKYFLLDTENSGCNIATQSRLLTGNLTGTERWNGRGDAIVRGQKERNAAAWYARSRSRKAC